MSTRSNYGCRIPVDLYPAGVIWLAALLPPKRQSEQSPSERCDGKQIRGARMNLYTLEVFLIGGPVTTEFIKQNPTVSRTIEIRGGQTLKDLHSAIFLAFDREEEHMYEFQFGGDGPNDPKARRYWFPVEPTGLKRDASKTKLDALKLRIDEAFGYWFDFGADWWHQVNVLSVDKKTPKGEHPRVIDRVGQSPPQYAEGLDEEDCSMIWTLRVELLDGLYAGEEKCVRVMEMNSSVTLEDLHFAIQDAVDFDNDHLYEFYIAKTERSRDKQRFDDENGGIFITTLEDIYPLEKRKKLYYLFDYGDSWLFKITKSRKKPHPPQEGIEYPRVIEFIEDNPDQYPNWEE
ncbi:hypothetical protein ACFL2Q_02290 [Thermodesulfobacteriota bacterium]